MGHCVTYDMIGNLLVMDPTELIARSCISGFVLGRLVQCGVEGGL